MDSPHVEDGHPVCYFAANTQMTDMMQNNVCLKAERSGLLPQTKESQLFY